MRMTIGRKLIISFLVLAMLVLLSGVVGFYVLNRSADSADTVAKDKAPAQYAVMNAALAIEGVLKGVSNYAGTSKGFEAIGAEVLASFDEFDMWIGMIQLGTASEEFKKSTLGSTYMKKGLKISVTKGSPEIQAALKSIRSERDSFKKLVVELMESHKNSEGYAVFVNNRHYTLPDFLNLAQLYHLNWLRGLKDAVNIETTFTEVTDPKKGLIGAWLHSTYKVDNEEFMSLVGKYRKQHEKLYGLAVKINGKEDYKGKLRIFNRGIGVTAKIERYFSEMHKLSALIYEEIEAKETSVNTQMKASAKNINNQLENLIGKAAGEMNEALATAETVKTRGQLILTVITLAAVVIAVIMGTLMSRYFSGRIGELEDTTRKISEGDLRETIKVSSNDELGQLATDTNTMIGNLRKMIGQILSFSENLTDSSKALAGISGALEDNANDLSSKASDATSATATMADSMEEITVTASESMERVQNVSQATEEMTDTINEIARNTEQARTVTTKAVQTVEKTTTKMNDLSEAAKEIGVVADVIVAIADQTNLLSLNATIEAARAGEAGKGFAVVANEVKELAAQTNSATENIRNKITAIQKSSEMSISEISEIASVINDINSIVVVIAGAVEEQAVTTQQIAEDIGSVTSGIEDMNNILGSTTQVAESVSNDIGVVNTTSNEVQSGSVQIGKNASELAKLAEELQVLVGKFQL